MVVGFVLVNAEPDKTRHVYDALQRTPEVTDLQALFGEYDFIVKAEAESFDDLGRIVLDRIRTVEGVLDTKTLTGTRL